MTDPEFFKQRRALSVAELGEIVGARISASSAKLGGRQVWDIAALDRAGPRDLARATEPGDEAALRRTRAGACVVSPALLPSVPAHTAALVVSDPGPAFVAAAQAMFGDALRPSSMFEAAGRAPAATVHPTARLEANVTIDPAAVVGPRAEIGSGTVVGPLAVIGPDVRIGRDCQIGPGACVTHALVGDLVSLGAGARIGGDTVNGGSGAQPVAAGRVIVQDGVKIGANSAIARGALGDTVVGEGARIGSLVSISADVTIDRHRVILAPASAADPAR